MKDNSMHITDQEMKKYVCNELSQHDCQRVELEIQLCDFCLERFVYWSSTVELSTIPSVDEAAENIAVMLTRKPIERRQHWIQRPYSQVLVAACITLLLVGSGLLSGISSTIASLEQQSTGSDTELSQPASPMTPSGDRWLDKAVHWIDKLQERRFQ